MIMNFHFNWQLNNVFLNKKYTNEFNNFYQLQEGF